MRPGPTDRAALVLNGFRRLLVGWCSIRCLHGAALRVVPRGLRNLFETNALPCVGPGCIGPQCGYWNREWIVFDVFSARPSMVAGATMLDRRFRHLCFRMRRSTIIHRERQS